MDMVRLATSHRIQRRLFVGWHVGGVQIVQGSRGSSGGGISLRTSSVLATAPGTGAAFAAWARSSTRIAARSEVRNELDVVIIVGRVCSRGR